MKPTLCLLHAFPLSSEMFAGQRAALADIIDVVTPDLAGFGRTPPHPTPSIDGMAAAVVAALGDRKVILGGVSMGGYVALAAARMFPGRFAGLVLIDTKAEPDDSAAKVGRATASALVRAKGVAALVEVMLPKLLGETTRRDRPAVVDQVRRLALAQSDEGVLAGLQALRDRPDARPSLAGMRVPTLLVYGAEDTLTPPSQGEALAAALGGELVVLSGAGHLPNLEVPDTFNAALRAWLTRVTPAG